MNATRLVAVLMAVLLPGCISVRGGPQSFAGSAAGPARNGRVLDVELHRKEGTPRSRVDLGFFLASTVCPLLEMAR